jgi:DNA-binding NtrC family response regulator
VVKSEYACLSSGNVKTILVVEDEFLVRLTVSDGLRDEGYDVLEAASGDEALDLFRCGVAIDVVFSDVRMPGTIDGLGLLAFVRDTYSELPVIITSGHLPSLPEAAGRATPFLPKPYHISQLTSLIENALAHAQ